MTWLLRHAETQWNRDRIGFGHTDIPLSAAGVEAAWKYRAPKGVRRIFTSPLSRAYETAAIIANWHHLPTPTVVPALIERHHGAGEGVPKKRRPAVIPGRETDEQIQARAMPFLQHLDDTCLVVTHSGVIYALTGNKVGHLEAEVY